MFLTSFKLDGEGSNFGQGHTSKLFYQCVPHVLNIVKLLNSRIMSSSILLNNAMRVMKFFFFQASQCLLCEAIFPFSSSSMETPSVSKAPFLLKHMLDFHTPDFIIVAV